MKTLPYRLESRLLEAGLRDWPAHPDAGGDVEDAGAAPDGVVEAAFHRQVGFPQEQALRCSGKVQQWLRLLDVRWRT